MHNGKLNRIDASTHTPNLLEVCNRARRRFGEGGLQQSGTLPDNKIYVLGNPFPFTTYRNFHTTDFTCT